MRRRDDGTIRVGSRVVTVKAVGPIPEGATGKVKVVDGLTWFRYWVKWDSGEWSAWVGDDAIVRTDRLAAYRAAAETAAAAAQAAASTAAASAAPASAPAEANGEGG